MNTETLELIAAIYDAAAEELGWQQVLDRITSYLGAGGITAFALDPSSGAIPISLTSGIDPKEMEDYKNHYIDKDFRLKLIMETKLGSVYTTSDGMMSSYDYAAEPFVREFLVPRKYYHCMGAKLIQRNQLVGILGIQGRIGDEFGNAERNLLTPLVPHFGRALDIAIRLAAVMEKGQLVEAALDQLNQAVFVLDIVGRVQVANKFAHTLVARRDGIAIVPGGRVAASGAAGARLEHLVREAVDFANGMRLDSTTAGGSVSVPRPVGRSYAVTVAPLPRRKLTIGGKVAGVVVVVVDPDMRAPGQHSRAAALFGLTPAEAAVADALAQGASVTEIAEARGISVNTAKTLLGRIFTKTGTSRQGELIRLLVLTSANIDTEAPA